MPVPDLEAKGARVSPTSLPGGLLPLWPFQTVEQADAWIQNHRAVGSDPQHRLDAAATALEFTRGALGYTGIDLVTASTGTDAEQFVGVGWRTEASTVLTAATVRLVRLGSDVQAPWVVVGTKGTSTALAVPGYGDQVSGGFDVGGRITGVDEALRVVVVGPGGVTLGRAGPIGVGGANQPWRARVALAPAPSGALLTVAVSSGGHLADVEWFAITAVTVG
jgi:hypothetical protein